MKFSKTKFTHVVVSFALMNIYIDERVSEGRDRKTNVLYPTAK